tara:strand:- start:559 stop:1314 length:756 start_codon:yes stop_codon:yes gene_type:complete
MVKKKKAEYLERYRRHILMKDIGGVGQKKLNKAKVLVIGLGGIGSASIQYLAGAGIGNIGIADSDTVALSNLQRQTIYSFKDIGKKKVEIASKFVSNLNQDVTIEKYDFFVNNPKSAEVISKYDLILDGTDNVKSRVEINKACIYHKKPLIFGGVSGWEGAVSFLLKDEGPCYECVFPGPDKSLNELDCVTEGVLGVTTSIIGSYMAAEAIKYICNTGRVLSNKLLIIDCLYGSFEVFSVKKNVNCRTCKS